MRRFQLRAALPALFGAAIGLTLACYVAPSQVGSRYVKSLPVQASQGATFTVSEAESPELAGTTLVIAPGALREDQTITVELGFDPIVPGDAVVAGPVAVFGPAGLVFTQPARLTLPYRLPSGGQTSQLFVQVREGDGALRSVPNAELEIAATTLSLDIDGFTSFQPGTSSALAQCGSNQQCPPNQVCVNGACQLPDGGPVLTNCQTSADCSNGEVCLNAGYCYPAPTSCVATSECEQGKNCVNGACTSCAMGTCPVPDAGVDAGTGCDPLLQNCPNGTFCFFAPTLQPSPYCAVPTDGQVEGQTCGPLDCSAGNPFGRAMYCSGYGSGALGTCREFCDVNVGSCSHVPFPRSCQQIPGGPPGVGSCEPVPTGCQTDADCGPMQSCLNDGTCGVAGSSCTTSASCAKGQQCVNGTCMVCSFGACSVPDGGTDAGTGGGTDGGGGFFDAGSTGGSDGGTSTDAGSSSGCTSHADCGLLGLCLNNGNCGTAPSGCNTSSTCPINTQCLNGTCQ